MKKSPVLGRALSAGIAASLMLMVAGPAAAWDGAVSGTIAAIDVTGGTNFGLRVMIQGASSMCTNGGSWAYLNEADSNYKTYAAAIMMAKAQGSTVTVYSTLENGYCHIGYMSFQ